MNPSKGKTFNLPQETLGDYGNIRRIDNIIINNFYPPWLIDFVSLLYEKDQTKRPTAAKALGFLKQLLTNPNVIALFNNLKSQKTNLNKFDQAGANNLFQIKVNNWPNIRQDLNPFNNINNIKVSKDFNGIVRGFPEKNLNDAGAFLQPNMGKENRILSSMKCLLYLLYKLDCINFIKYQLQTLLNNSKTNYNQFFTFYFCQMLDTVKLLENGQINIPNYNQNINNFIQNIFINNNSGISGARPIILFYMMSSIFKDEFQKNFNICQNNIYDNIIKNNFSDFNVILPMNNQIVYQKINEKIFAFKNLYKGPFVDNFYFLQSIIIIKMPSMW